MLSIRTTFVELRSDNDSSPRKTGKKKPKKKLKDGVVFIHIVSEATDVSRLVEKF